MYHPQLHRHKAVRKQKPSISIQPFCINNTVIDQRWSPSPTAPPPERCGPGCGQFAFAYAFVMTVHVIARTPDQLSFLGRVVHKNVFGYSLLLFGTICLWALLLWRKSQKFCYYETAVSPFLAICDHSIVHHAVKSSGRKID